VSSRFKTAAVGTGRPPAVAGIGFEIGSAYSEKVSWA